MNRIALATLIWIGVATLGHMQLWLWLRSSFPRLVKHARPMRVVFVGLVLLPTIARFITSHTRSPFFAGVYAFAMTELMIVLIAAIPLAIVRLAAIALARRAKPTVTTEPETSLAAPLPAPDVPAPSLGRRQLLERAGGAVVLGATSSTLAWGALVGRYDFSVEEVVVRIVGLPKVLDGYTITQVSDLHVGSFVQEKELALGLSLVKGTKPDLIVVTGDLVDFDRDYIPTLLTALGKLEARDGIKAILGNHDYYTGADAIAGAMRGAGFDMLVNDGRLIRAADGGGFALLGVDDLWAARYQAAGPQLDRALSFVPPDRPRILLSHQPASVDLWPGRVALQLSGHTHGGQVNPGFRPADLLMHYVSGRYEVEGTTLYVNRGFGVVGPPARVAAPPEITKIILISA